MLELLEVPQLMDTCIRNGSYDDALDLKGFIGKLAFMHSDLKAVQNLVKEVDAASASMLEQLLQKLRSNIQLPDCLRMIGYLRRLGVFSERVSWMCTVSNRSGQQASSVQYVTYGVHKLRMYIGRAFACKSSSKRRLARLVKVCRGDCML